MGWRDGSMGWVFFLLLFFLPLSVSGAPDCKEWIAREMAMRAKNRHWPHSERRRHKGEPLPLNRFLPPEKQPPGTKLLPIPILRQCTDAECGVTSVAAIMGGFGIDARAHSASDGPKVDEEWGTDYTELVAWAVRLGFETDVKVRYRQVGRPPHTGKGEKATLDDIKRSIDAGNPVLVLVQAFADGEKPDYTRVLEDGHYVVVVGYTPGNLIVMDPCTTGRLAYVPELEFLDRWHLLDGDEDMQENLAVIFTHRTGLVHDPAVVVPLLATGKKGSLFDFARRADVALIGQAKAGYSGPAALQSLLHRYGHDYFQDDVAKELGWRAGSDGEAPARRLVQFTAGHGLPARTGGLGVKEIEALVSKGRPVMVKIHPPGEAARWVIVFAFNGESVLLMDPKEQFNYTVVGRKEFPSLRGATGRFEALWIDRDPETFDLFSAEYMN